MTCQKSLQVSSRRLKVSAARKLSAAYGLKSLAAALVLFLPIIGTAQTLDLLNQSAQSAKPQVLVFSDGGDDRNLGHATTDASGNLYIASDLGDPRLTNSFGVVKYNAQGKLAGVFHFHPKTLGNGDAFDVKVDTAGNVYACGFTFPFGGLVISFDPSGKTRWTQIIGNDRLSSMVLDKSGNIYVGGDSAGAILVAKLTTGGKVLWKRQQKGTTTGAQVTSVQLDSKGNLVVVGATSISQPFFDTTVLKLDPQGNILFTENFGEGPGFKAVPAGAALDQNDAIYATGTAINLFTGDQIPYTLKYDTDGNRDFVLTGAGIGGTAIAVGTDGDILLHGATFIKDETVPTVSKLDPAGKLIFVVQIPTLGKLTTDSQGNIYVSGAAFSGDAFAVTKLNRQGAILFNFNLPLPNFQSLDNIGDSILDPFGNLLVTGNGQPKPAGLDDILVLKLPKGFEPALCH